MTILTLGQVENMCNRAGMRAEARVKAGDFTIYIADGFSSQPHITFQRFGVEKNEFPCGAFGTFGWIAKGDLVTWGVPMFFDAFHDAEQCWSRDMKKVARVAAVRKLTNETLRDIVKEEKRASAGRA